jgi:hypothetical protein
MTTAMNSLKASLQAEGRRRMTHQAPESFENPLTLDHAALALSPVPVLGDVVGLGADAYDWYQHPDNRTLGNALLVGAGVLPFVPPVAAAGRQVGNAMLDAMTTVPGSPSAQRGAITWHGTPHRFVPTENNPLGEFDLSKIGTGEGAQAYGHGVYLAEEPGVASSYKMSNDLLASNIRLANYAMKRSRNNVEKAKQLLDEEGADSIGYAAEQYKYVRDNLDHLLSNDVKGYLYKVDLPDEHINKMLDWDKPLSEQPHALRALEDFAFPETTGADVYRALSEGGDPSENSAWLHQRGIPGIRYLDGGSRNAGQGTSNYVVFDPSITRILGRE